MKKIRLLLIIGLVGAGLAAKLQGQQYVISEVMNGLVTPRGLALGPDGGLYVAEAGSGGDGPSFTLGSGNEAFLGNSSGLTRLLNGVQERVLDGLPSVAQANGTEASGLQDIVFDGTGQAFGLFGLGGNPSQRNSDLGTAGAVLGTIVRLPLDGTGAVETVADIAGFELTANPDGTAIDSNPFGLALSPSGDFLVADAGANDVLAATTAGAVSTVAVLPARANPLFPNVGGPTFQSVPTAVAVGPDGDYYIGQLTGFPFISGAANIYRFDPVSEELTTAFTDFTNVVDLTFDSAGNLYVLQITSNGLASPSGPGPGALIKIDAATGERTTIASDGLMFPGSVVAAPDGTLYVSNHTNSPSGGQVLAIQLVPEPSSLPLLVVGFIGLALQISRNAQRTVLSRDLRVSPPWRGPFD